MLAKRLYLSGLVVMGLFAVGHFTGFVQGAHAARHDPDLVDLTRAMQAHRANLLGFQPSLLDFREYFSLNFSILLLLSAGLGFVALTGSAPNQPVIRRLSLVYAVGMLMLLGTSVHFSIAQGIVTCPAIAVLFALAWWLEGGSH